MRRRITVVAALLVLAGLAAAPGQAATVCRPGEDVRLGSASVAYAGQAKRELRAFGRPGGRVLARFGLRNANGFPTIFSLRAVRFTTSCEPAWYRAQLPIRPNGVTGYVRADALIRYRVRKRVLIDLSARRVVLFRDGQRVFRATAAIGSRSTPTPTGRFYVNQRVRFPNPNGVYGPAAVGISAFSPVLTWWAQGGPIAIHGTNQPWSIGKAISTGCLRLRTSPLERLFRMTPAGAPVTIRR